MKFEVEDRWWATKHDFTKAISFIWGLATFSFWITVILDNGRSQKHFKFMQRSCGVKVPFFQFSRTFKRLRKLDDRSNWLWADLPFRNLPSRLHCTSYYVRSWSNYSVFCAELLYSVWWLVLRTSVIIICLCTTQYTYYLICTITYNLSVFVLLASNTETCEKKGKES